MKVTSLKLFGEKFKEESDQENITKNAKNE